MLANYVFSERDRVTEEWKNASSKETKTGKPGILAAVQSQP